MSEGCAGETEAEGVEALTWEKAGMFEGPKGHCGWNA